MVHELKGSLVAKGVRVGVVAGRFNEFISKRLLEGALDEIEMLGGDRREVTVAWAPGSYEMPLLARAFAESGNVDVVLCLGAVIRGETDHYRFVAEGAARGIAMVSQQSGIPVMFGVLTVDTLEQAIHRAGAKSGNKGAETARAALETLSVLRQIKES